MESNKIIQLIIAGWYGDRWKRALDGSEYQDYETLQRWTFPIRYQLNKKELNK